MIHLAVAKITSLRVILRPTVNCMNRGRDSTFVNSQVAHLLFDKDGCYPNTKRHTMDWQSMCVDTNHVADHTTREKI